MVKRFKDAQGHSKGSNVRYKELLRENKGVICTKHGFFHGQADYCPKCADSDESWQASEALLERGEHL